jgi:hypothetical protein
MSTWARISEWVLTLDIKGKEDIAKAVIDGKVDGDTLLNFKDMANVKSILGIPGGKANKVYQAIEALRAASAGSDNGISPAVDGGMMMEPEPEGSDAPDAVRTYLCFALLPAPPPLHTALE